MISPLDEQRARELSLFQKGVGEDSGYRIGVSLDEESIKAIAQALADRTEELVRIAKEYRDPWHESCPAPEAIAKAMLNHGRNGE